MWLVSDVISLSVLGALFMLLCWCCWRCRVPWCGRVVMSMMLACVHVSSPMLPSLSPCVVVLVLMVVLLVMPLVDMLFIW